MIHARFTDAVNYSLAKLAKKPKGTRVVLPGIEDRLSTYKSYQRILNSMLSALAQEVRRDIIPMYQAELALKRTEQRRTVDAPERTWFTRLTQLAARLAGISDAMVDRVLRTEADRHTDEFIAVARRSLGVDLTSVVSADDVDELLRVASARNASLISSLAADTVKRVEQAVLTNFTAGNSVKTLKQQLTREFGVLQSRAELIAYDQTAKLNADLNEYRHRQAGISKYVWTTSHDERVRPRHRAIDGNTYQYGKPTGAEQGLPPGKPIRCRCIARAIVEF